MFLLVAVNTKPLDSTHYLKRKVEVKQVRRSRHANPKSNLDLFSLYTFLSFFTMEGL